MQQRLHARLQSFCAAEDLPSHVSAYSDIQTVVCDAYITHRWGATRKLRGRAAADHEPERAEAEVQGEKQGVIRKRKSVQNKP